MKERGISRRRFRRGVAVGLGLVAAGPGILARKARAQRRFKTSALAFGHSQKLMFDFIKNETGPKYGIDLGVKTTFDARTIYTMMVAKGADFYETGWLTLADLVARKQVKAKNIYSSYFQDAPLYVPVNSPIKSLQEIRGKRVGAYGSAAGTSTQMIAVVLKDVYGIDLFKDVKVLFGASPVLHETLKRGELDAAYNTPIAVPEILDADKFRVLIRPRDAWYEKTGVRLLITTLATYDEILEKHPEDVRNFLKARNEALEVWNKDIEIQERNLSQLTGLKDKRLLRLLTETILRNYNSQWDNQVIQAHQEFGRRVMEMFGKDRVAGVPDEAFTTAFNP